VFLELRMPTTSVVAGSMVTPEFQVRNSSNNEVSLSSGVSVARDGRDQASNGGQPDPREFPAFRKTGPPGAYDTRVPAGQTRAFVAMAQVPFDASGSVHLHAAAGVGNTTSNVQIQRPVVSVLADIPLRLGAATPADQLKLELKADRQQWCLRATDASGGRPIGPLYIRLTASDGMGTLMASGIPGGTGDAWAQRLSRSTSPSIFHSGAPLTLTMWVGGPHYVTARAETTISATP
jgi:hypothetical protein